MSDIEATYIVTDEAFNNAVYVNDLATEFETEDEAIDEAHEMLSSLGDDAEVYVWKLSHVLTKDVEVNIEVAS